MRCTHNDVTAIPVVKVYNRSISCGAWKKMATDGAPSYILT